MSERVEVDREAAEREWWSRWWAEDYSWEGLGKRDANDNPLKPWKDWVVVERDRSLFCEPFAEGAAQKIIRLASLQDYWCADPENRWKLRSFDDLINLGELVDLKLYDGSNDVHFWHIIHFPPKKRYQSTLTWKKKDSSEYWSLVEKILSTRFNASYEVFSEQISLEKINIICQLSGSILRGSEIIKNKNYFYNCIEARQAAFLYKFDCTEVRFAGHSDFSGSAFFSFADFTKSRFYKSISFAACYFFGEAKFDDVNAVSKEIDDEKENTDCQKTLFINCIFFGNASFGRVFFDQKTIFDGSYFHSDAMFSKANFGSEGRGVEARFFDCYFRREANFHEAKFYGEAIFSNTKFNWTANISNVKFFRSAEFESSIFLGNSNFNNINPKGRLNFKFSSFERIIFGFEFDKNFSTDQIVSGFREVKFNRLVDFRSDPFRVLPMFEGSQIHGGIVFSKPCDTNSLKIFDKEVIASALKNSSNQRDIILRAAELGAQALKFQMKNISDSTGEQILYRCELKSRSLQSVTHWSERFTSNTYELMSNYGVSVYRPIIRLGFITLMFSALYFLAAAMMTDMSLDTLTIQLGAPLHPSIAHALELTLTNALGPLRYWGSDYQPYAGMDADPGFRLVIGTLGLIQQLISFILIFLAALALRRRFQIG
ncbi:MAG: pentapeptide repeat-containing protein [Oceanicaulis sp.]